MEYRGFYKNASRGNRLKEENSQHIKSKRESSRQNLRWNNRNLNISEFENEENNVLSLVTKSSHEKSKRRRSDREENKENDYRSKYEERLQRLRKFKEERAKAKQQNAAKPKPFVSVVPKNNLVDREYEQSLFKQSEAEIKRLAEKRKVLTPAAKHATPRVDSRRNQLLPHTTAEKDRPKKEILCLKTPASVKLAKPKVDTWRKGTTPGHEDNDKRAEKRARPNLRTKIVTTTVTKTKDDVTSRHKQAATAVSNRKGATQKPFSGSALKAYQLVRSGQKSSKFNFNFASDGRMVTSTNRKKKSLEQLLNAGAEKQQKTYRFSPKENNEDEDVFAGISPIDVDTPTPKKPVQGTDDFAMMRREARRRSMVFTVENVKQEDWEPQVIAISDDDSDAGIADKTKVLQTNASFTVAVKEEKLLDRRPTIDESRVLNSPKVVGSGRKSFGGRASLLFTEDVKPHIKMDPAQVTSKRASLVFNEENVPKIATIEIFDSPKTVNSPLARLSGTPKMQFIEEDVQTVENPAPNLATVLLNKQEQKNRNSGGRRRSSLMNFREENLPPADVRNNASLYYNLIDKELHRLQDLCNQYSEDVENEEIDENSKGLIIAAQGQTKILISKKLSKFRELVSHYESCWSDQKVRLDDLEGFWLMVKLDLENLDRRFEELRVLKQDNWNIPQHPKPKSVNKNELPVATIEISDSPKRSPSVRVSGTPKMNFVEEDAVPKALPTSNLATVLLNKQDAKGRSSDGSRRSSVNSFREEDQPPADVRDKVVFYYDLVDKELKRLQNLCDLYKDDMEKEEINEHCKGLMIAAQGQTNILINKKLSKFKELVGHYERCWSDQKVRTDDLDGFWQMVSLDLENLDRRFEELRLLKENNWEEIVEQQKTKKLKGGGGIKKREKKPMKTKASGLADLIKKAREEAKKKQMFEAALTETVTVVTTPIKRSVRIATTPKRDSITRNSMCAVCTPTSGKAELAKKSRKTIFNDHSLRKHEIVKSILKTPSEKRRAKSVLFLDSGLDTPDKCRAKNDRKIIHTPKPKITFNEELEVETLETISLTTPYKLEDEIRKRRRSSLFPQEHQLGGQEDDVKPEEVAPMTRRRTLRFSTTDTAKDEAAAGHDEACDQIGSPTQMGNAMKEKAKRKTRCKTKGRVSFL